MCWSRVLAVSIMVVTLAAGCGGSGGDSTATAGPAAQPSPTATATSTATVTATPFPTATPEPTGTPMPAPTGTPAPPDPAVYHEITFNGLDEGDGGNLRLYTVDADGSDLHPLTSALDGVWEAFPAPSPDGSRVAFLRGSGSAPAGSELPPAEVRVIDLMTDEETLIVTGLGTDFSWSPDSHQLAFTWFEGGSNPCCGGTQGLTSRLVLVNADGSDFQVLSEEQRDPVTYAGSEDSQPLWSPDGTRLLFLRSRNNSPDFSQQPAILDLETFEVTELDTGDVQMDDRFAWMLDGRSIVFLGGSGADLSSPGGVYLLDIDGGAIRQLTDLDLSVSNFVVSPDGTHMALAARSTTPMPGVEYTPNHLAILDIASGYVREYESGWVFNDLAWSADGTRIAYLENQDNLTELNLPFLRVVDVDTGRVSEPLATIWPTEMTRRFPVWRPTITVLPSTDHGWGDDSLQAVVPGGLYDAVVRPHVDYPWIAWSAAESTGDHNVYALNIDTRQIVTVPTGPVTNWDVSVADGMVVWSERDCVECSITRIHGRDLVRGNEFSIDLPPSVTWSPPAFSGRWVVWVEYSAEYASRQRGVIYARDVLAMSAEPVVVTTVSSGPFTVSGDFVAWVEPASDNSQSSRIVVLDLLTGTVVAVIDTLEADHSIYPIDLDGWTLVHVEDGPWPNDDPEIIVITDLLTGATRTLETYVQQHEGGFPITTDGRFIIFQQDTAKGYDIERDTWFKLPVDRHSVDLDDGMLVWSMPYDYLSGPTELHLALAEQFSSGQRSRYFPETDQWLAFRFLAFWDGNGQLPVFGFPITPATPVAVSGVPSVQWLERQRFEWHPANAGTAYEIQLGRLGAELLDLQGREWRSFPTADPAAPHYFALTGHVIAPQFWDFWAGHGLDLGDRGVLFRESVALFGYPLSEPMLETNADGDTVVAQYFERAVFEYYPDNLTEWRVLLRRLGAESIAGRGW